MLSESCPACASPLFKLGEEVWCSKCNKRVVIVKREEEVSEVTRPILLSDLEGVLLRKVQKVMDQIRGEEDHERLQRLCRLLLMWLEALERIRKVRI
jgi:uncharacterized Zn finger protein (UPF0148 family)